MKLINYGLLSLLALLLASCSTTHSRSSSRYQYQNDELPSNYQSFDSSKIPNATPKVEPLSRYGNPSSYVVLGHKYHVLTSAKGYDERGIASYYGVKFHNYKTSNGEIYNMYGMSAANKVLPLPTYVRVTNLENHRQVIVRVNDRGPFHENRIIDLSFAAAKKLDMVKTGTALVEVTAIDPSKPEAIAPSRSLKQIRGTPHVYLQLGAFSKESSAENFENTLHRYTQRQIRIVQGMSHERTVYRVQIGPLTSVDEADQLTAAFKKHGLGDAFAVIE